MTIIQQLADSFIREAISSPVLMNDLATMEMYIAESYTGRSLIELLQNADDAGATKFLIQSLDNSTFIAANNGRKFTPEDLQSLCRSGASTKQRKSNTIGFRGIGFKAVVNYSENVHVLSGEYAFSFSRAKTFALLPQDIRVPLIRIPHEYTESRFGNHIDELTRQRYESIFIFETINNKLEQELKEFSADCLLFLNHVTEIIFAIGNDLRIIKSEKTENEYGTICHLNSENSDNEWLVIKSKKDKSSLALKWENGKVKPCNREEAVVHSFLPTQETLTIPLKINGDFSTEPSRTRIACDNETMIAVSSCADLIVSLFEKILLSGTDKLGFTNILSFLNHDPISKLRGIRINDLINEEFISGIRQSLDSFVSKKGKKGLTIQPSWLADEDVDLTSNDSEIMIFGNIEERIMPGMRQLLLRLGFKEYDINSALKVSKANPLTHKTRVNIINTIANDPIYGLDNERVSLMKQAKLFDSDTGIFSVEGSTPDTLLSDDFTAKIISNTEDTTKISYVLKRIGLSEKQINSVMPAEKPEPQELNVTKSFAKKVIKKWRSVEKNVAALLETFEKTQEVEDVSEKNLGYDIRVKNKDGIECYYEVKSVNYLGDSISITNNEYSTANEYGKRYYLAITEQSEDEIKVCFVCDPLKKLDLIKRVVRWEWVANSYDGVVVEGELET